MRKRTRRQVIGEMGPQAPTLQRSFLRSIAPTLQRLRLLLLGVMFIVGIVFSSTAQILVGEFLSDSGQKLQLNYDPARNVYELTPFHIPRYEILTYTPAEIKLLIRGFRITLSERQELTVSDGPITQISMLPDVRGLRLSIRTDQPLVIEHTREMVRLFVRQQAVSPPVTPVTPPTLVSPGLPPTGTEPTGTEPMPTTTSLSVLLFWDTGAVRRDTLTVDAEGFVEYQELGRISVRGLAPLAIQMFLAQELSRYLRQYLVVVYTRRVKGPSVSIVGALRSEQMQGEHSWRSGMMLAATLNQIGGWTPRADLNHVWVYRLVEGEHERETVDVSELLSHGGDIPLRPDDIVYLPIRREKAEVGVFGQVKQPGNLSIGEDTTLSQALRLAGGPGAASTSLTVSLLRADGERLDIPYEQIQGPRDLRLRHGDVIYLHTRIPRSK